MSKITISLCSSLRVLAKGMRLVDFTVSNIAPGDFIIVDNCTIMACTNTKHSSCYISGGLALHVISVTKDAEFDAILTCIIMRVSNRVENSINVILHEAGDWVNVGSLCMVAVNNENSVERTALKVVHRD